MKALLSILLLFSLSAQGQFYLLNQGSGGAITDSSVITYLDRVAAHGVTITSTQRNAVNAYFTGLKAQGIWNKIVDRGLLIWQNAAANAETFKGLFDVTWNGTVAHLSKGVQGDGTTGWGNTNIQPPAHLASTGSGTPIHLSVYCQTNSAITNGVSIGSANSASQRNALYLRSGTNAFLDAYNATTSQARLSVANSSSQGYIMGTRVSATDSRIFKGGTQVGSTQTTSAGLVSTIPIGLMVMNVDSGPIGWSNRIYSLWSFGHGLTPTEAYNDNLLTEQLMDALGIGVQ